VRNKSELVFEDYCRERGYQAERITPEVNAGQFPDYHLVTPAGPVIVEMKEFTANEADKRFVETLNKEGRADYRRSPGKRVYNAIKDAAPQLRRYRDTAFPEVLLVYDNLQPLDIAAGMFGSPVMRFWLDPDQKPIDATDSTHGGSRQLTETERLYQCRRRPQRSNRNDPDPNRLLSQLVHNQTSMAKIFFTP
jgi:hypothetical protein